MRYSRIFKLLTVCSVLLMAVSCQKFLDVNKNPNDPESVPESLQLSALEGNFSYEILANNAVRTTSLWTQQTAWNGVPPSDDNYDVKENDVNNLWQYWSYTDVMNNARKMDAQAIADGNFAYSAIAKTILAWNLSVVTDLWNEVPYSKAFDPTNPTPEYDTQENVYKSIFTLLDDAIANYGKSSSKTPGSDDLLYGGDLTKWQKLTYTLKARLLMHLTNAPGYTAATQAQAALDALQNGFASNSDNANFTYYDAQGSENPWYQFAIDGKWDTRNQLSKTYVDLLTGLNDPRLPIQARPVGAVDGNGAVSGTITNPTYVGHANGTQGEGTANISSIGSFYSAAGAPLNWMNYAEAKFIEAEATFITSGAAAADPIYRDAIRASMDQLGVTAADRETYVSNQAALTDATALRDIITQKYIANFLHFEVYNDWRRTGFPQLTIASGAKTTVIPVRYPYPSSELQNNAANVKKTGIPVGYTSMEQHVWWDPAN